MISVWLSVSSKSLVSSRCCDTHLEDRLPKAYACLLATEDFSVVWLVELKMPGRHFANIGLNEGRDTHTTPIVHSVIVSRRDVTKLSTKRS